MKPFDIKDKCPKCECRNIKTMHFPQGRVSSVHQTQTPEHLQRTCSRCQHSWSMAVAGSDTPDGEVDLTEERPD
jgi:predicted nucleic-acid-binding Zn-ribbon protein